MYISRTTSQDTFFLSLFLSANLVCLFVSAGTKTKSNKNNLTKIPHWLSALPWNAIQFVYFTHWDFFSFVRNRSHSFAWLWHVVVVITLITCHIHTCGQTDSLFEWMLIIFILIIAAGGSQSVGRSEAYYTHAFFWLFPLRFRSMDI